MMQLYCPACENVVSIEADEGEEFVPCPSCRKPIYWLERRKARPLSNSSEREPRIIAIPERSSSPPHVPASSPVAQMAEEEFPIAEVRTNWESEADPDFNVPFPDAEPLRFVALPYRAEGGVRVGRLPFFVLGLLTCGIGLGALASILGENCYLILLYPLVMGLILAGLTIFFAHLAHMRSPVIAGLTGFATGAITVLTMHYLDYRRTLSIVEATPHQLPSDMAAQLKRSPGFLDYLLVTAQEGLTISGRDGDGLNLGTAGTYAYWSLEVLLVVLIASIGGATGSRDPYCSSCRGWKEDRFLGTLADGGAEQQRIIQRGRLPVLECYRPSTTSGPLVFTASVCPRCGCESPIDLRVEWNPRVKKSPVTTNLPLQLTYPGEALPVLERLFTLPQRSAA